MKRALVFVVLLVALMLLLAAPAALAIVDPIAPADECRGTGGVGSQAIPALNETGKIVGFPVPNNTPGKAAVTGNPNGVPDACLA